jgi:hypothetical protein
LEPIPSFNNKMAFPTTIAQEWGYKTEAEMLTTVELWFGGKMREMLDAEEFLCDSDEPEDKIMDFEAELVGDGNGWCIAVTTINNEGDEVDIAVELTFTREDLYNWSGNSWQTTYGGTRWELCPSRNLRSTDPAQ